RSAGTTFHPPPRAPARSGKNAGTPPCLSPCPAFRLTARYKKDTVLVSSRYHTSTPDGNGARWGRPDDDRQRDWQPDPGPQHALEADRVHSLRVQLRDPHAARWTRRAPLRADPGRQGPPGVEGLHLSEGAPARSLPERTRRAHPASAAAARGWLFRDDRVGHGDRRGRGSARRGARSVR